VSFRLLASFSGLTLGDYLLWNWSLSNNRDVLALVSGLTLPPLAAALVWLVALNAARLVARSSRRTPALVGRWLVGGNRDWQRRQARGPSASAGPLAEQATALHDQGSRLLDKTAGSPGESPAPAASSAPSPRKLAA
jgi:hypothetical protein